MSENQPNQSESHVNVLVAGLDLHFARAVQLACQQIAPQNKDKNYRVFPAANKEKLFEALSKNPYHSVIIEKEFAVDESIDAVLAQVKDMLAKKNDGAGTAIILATTGIESIDQTARSIRHGWTDVIDKHLDNSLFVQKMSLYNPKIPFMKDDSLFVMEVAKDVSLAFQHKTKTISEFGMKVESHQAMAQGLCLMVIVPLIEEPLCAVVLNCKPTDKTFEVSLMFVGVTPAQTQAIRKYIRHEYAEEKQAA